MRRLGAGLALLTVAATALVWAAPAASAKGAQHAVLRGPDVLKGGVAKLDQHQTATLALATSFYNAIWNPDSGASRVVPREPTEELGPRYVVTYNLMVGQDETVPIRQRLYPFAARGPVAFTPPGQPLETQIQKIGATAKPRACKDCRRLTGGWFDMRYGALDVLAAVGVSVPAALDRSTWPAIRDDAHGVSIAYPPSWHAAASTLVPVQLDPIIPLAIGTSALEPQHPDECGIIPTRALAAVGPTDAFVAVYLTQGMASWSAALRMERSGRGTLLIRSRSAS